MPHRRRKIRVERRFVNRRPILVNDKHALFGVYDISHMVPRVINGLHPRIKIYSFCLPDAEYVCVAVVIRIRIRSESNGVFGRIYSYFAKIRLRSRRKIKPARNGDFIFPFEHRGRQRKIVFVFSPAGKNQRVLPFYSLFDRKSIVVGHDRIFVTGTCNVFTHRLFVGKIQSVQQRRITRFGARIIRAWRKCGKNSRQNQYERR